MDFKEALNFLNIMNQKVPLFDYPDKTDMEKYFIVRSEKYLLH